MDIAIRLLKNNAKDTPFLVDVKKKIELMPIKLLMEELVDRRGEEWKKGIWQSLI
ncbi:MAG: hypothetical protein U5K27_07515 [Desulfotignum sp.]|nr:hypothetical protein [Desulfotignum sp.]